MYKKRFLKKRLHQEKYIKQYLNDEKDMKWLIKKIGSQTTAYRLLKTYNEDPEKFVEEHKNTFSNKNSYVHREYYVNEYAKIMKEDKIRAKNKKIPYRGTNFSKAFRSINNIDNITLRYFNKLLTNAGYSSPNKSKRKRKKRTVEINRVIKT